MIDVSKVTWYTLHGHVYICGREEGCSPYHHVSIAVSTPFYLSVKTASGWRCLCS